MVDKIKQTIARAARKACRVLGISTQPEWLYLPGLNLRGGYMPTPKPWLAIGPHDCMIDLSNTVAHEMRHYWQSLHGMLPDRHRKQRGHGRCAVCWYYSQPHELDALEFAHSLYPTDETSAVLQWMNTEWTR